MPQAIGARTHVHEKSTVAFAIPTRPLFILDPHCSKTNSFGAPASTPIAQSDDSIP
jgi:hypothetical protein